MNKSILTFVLLAIVSVFSVTGYAQPRSAAAPVAGDNVVIAPSVVGYQTLKDNVGKSVANRSVALQVTVTNNSGSQSFKVSSLTASFNANQCQLAKQTYENFDVTKCEAAYDANFGSPVAFAPKDMRQVVAEAQMGNLNSGRAKLFRTLDAVVAVGGGLSGFNLMGTGGRAALSVVSATGIPALQSLFPDMSAAKMARLIEQGAQPVIIQPNSSQTFLIFIPAEQIFTRDTWKLYTSTAQTNTQQALEFKRAMQLYATVVVHGSQFTESQPVTVTSGLQP